MSQDTGQVGPTRFGRWCSGLAASLVVALMLGGPAAAQTEQASPRPTRVVIASGAIASTDYQVAGAACEVLREGGGPFCAVAPTLSGAAAFKAARDGDAEFALLRADAYLAAMAALAAAGDVVSMAPVLALHDDVVTLIGRKDRGSGQGSGEARDLVGTRVNIGVPETITRGLWQAMETAIGADASDFSLRTELRAQEAGRALCEGRIDGFVWLLSHPSGATRALLETCDARVLNLRGPGVEALLAKRPDLRRVVIPSTLYGTNAETETIGMPALLVAGPQVDDETVAALARTLVSNVPVLAKRHPSLERIDTPSMIARGIPAALHPAAAAIYRDMGLTY